MIRYAVIGTSWITDAFVEGAAQGAPQLKLAAVYSRSEEQGRRFADKHGVELVFTDLAAMAASDQVDAVYIASPNALHYPQAKLMLEGGKHVICEKTCVVDSAQLADLLALADRKKLVFMEAIKNIHMPEMKVLEQALPQLGLIHLAKFDFSRYSSKYPQYLAGESPNIFNPKLAAGVLMDMGIYSVYPAVHLFGEPETVAAHATFLRTGADGAGAALLGYPNMAVNLTYSKMSDCGVESTIQGDRGIFSIQVLEHLDVVDFLPSGSDQRQNLIRRDLTNKPMGYEAYDFWRYITDPEGSRTDYERVTRTTVAVIRTMDRIRAAAGIKFD